MPGSSLRRRVGLLLSVLILALLLMACSDEASVSGNPTPLTTSAPTTTTAPSTTSIATTALITTEAVTPPATAAAPTNLPTVTLAPTATTTAIMPTVTPVPTTAVVSPIATKLPTVAPGKINATGKIVYSNGGGYYLIKPDGTGKTKLSGIGNSPIFSPDGQRLASIADHYTLISTKLDGSDRKVHCDLNSGNYPYLERWSPNGRFVAFAGSVRYADYATCDMQAKAGADSQNILRTFPGNYEGPSQPHNVYDWSPDNNFTIWQSVDENLVGTIYYGSATKGGTDAIPVVTAKPTNSDQERFFYEARISPDGKTIAVWWGKRVFFVSVPGQKSKLDGITLDMFDNPGRMVFSPDGKYLAVDNDSETKKGIFFYNIETRQVTPFIEGEAYISDWGR